MDTTATRTVTAVAPSEAERAVAVIVLAFSADPAARWTYPDPHHYLTHFPAVVRALGGRAFARGTAHQVSRFAGAALWLPPGTEPDVEALGSLVSGTVAAELQGEVSAVFARMGSYHPREPHWYLPLVGVDPAHQRKGYGGALLQHALSECDRHHAPAYLESTNPLNIPLYKRHGFEVLDTIQVGSSPPIVPMLRVAQ
jgi:GNAT superfamily N-acetyltransferase